MPKLSDFKALLFDVDNTLSKKDKTISPRTISALLALANNGYVVGICTGRVLGGVQKYIFPFFPSQSLHIISGGAQVVSSIGQILWQKVIPAETSSQLCGQLLATHADFMVGTANTMALTPEFKKEFEKFQIPLVLADLEEIRSWETPLISVIHITPEIRQIISHFPELNIKEMETSSFGGSYIDITAPGVNKASGFQHWSEITTIRTSDVIGFGDSDNDLEFLQNAGYSVAMGNSSATVKQIAKRVIGHTDDDGLAVYLEQILQGELL